jgi:hypothetical protein
LVFAVKGEKMSLSIDKVRKQFPHYGLSGDHPVTKNLARLMELRITLSKTAFDNLYTPVNPLLFNILKGIDLQKCASPQSAVETINQYLPQAFIANTVTFGRKIPREFFLTELGAPTARFKYVLDATLA